MTASEQHQQASLSTRDLTIRFGGHVAVDRVTADFYPGTLTVIVGPNGAGKTTYFNLVSGQLAASAGSVHVAGQDVTRLGPAHRTRLGVGRAFQLTNLFPHLTVLENVRLAVQSRAGIGLNMFSVWFGHKEVIARVIGQKSLRCSYRFVSATAMCSVPTGFDSDPPPGPAIPVTPIP